MTDTVQTDWMENTTYDELFVGQTASFMREITRQDIAAFATLSGDINPAHLNEEYANASLFEGVIAHGMFGAALISALLGTRFPGPGTIYLGQEIKFTKPVRIGDRLTIQATVTSKNDEKQRIKMDCAVINQHGEVVLKGEAKLMPPSLKIRVPRITGPQIVLVEADGQQNPLSVISEGL